MSKSVRHKIFYEELLYQIKEGKLKNGDRLPSERELCNIYGISRTTVREALRILEKNGYLIRIQGNGSFIQMKPIKQSLTKLYTLRNKFKEEGIKHNVEILDFSIVEADEDIKEALNIIGKVYKLKRIFYAANIPYAIERTYLPIDKLPFMTREMIENDGLYNTLDNYNFKPMSADETIGAKKIDEVDIQYLNLKKDTVVIETIRISCFKNEIIEYSKNIIRNDYFIYSVHLE